MEHTHLIGPTGSGKSTAMQHLILSDIKAARSVIVIDPKQDLVSSVLSRIPEERAGDVVVIDPSSPCPVGFNPLGFTNYQNKALIADAKGAFITGSTFLIDGGATSSYYYGPLKPEA